MSRIILAPYDRRWPALFAEERERLQEAIDDWAVAIEHVGSTAIPGIAAKPIIDIGVALARLSDALYCITPLVELGYECLGEFGLPGRIYFRKVTEAPLPGQVHDGRGRTHHLHMYELGHPEWDAHVTFRDYLRSHPETAAEYEVLKRQLAARYDDVNDYANAKCDFVRGVLVAAGYDVSRKTWSDELAKAAGPA